MNDIKTAAEQDIDLIVADDRPRGWDAGAAGSRSCPLPAARIATVNERTIFSRRRRAAAASARRITSGHHPGNRAAPARACRRCGSPWRGPQPPSLRRAFVLYELPRQQLVGLLLQYGDGSDGADCARERLLTCRGLALRRHEDVHGRRTSGHRYEASIEAITAPAIVALLDPAQTNSPMAYGSSSAAGDVGLARERLVDHQGDAVVRRARGRQLTPCHCRRPVSTSVCDSGCRLAVKRFAVGPAGRPSGDSGTGHPLGGG